MDRISEKETALLGLLSEEPRHAYSIEQAVKFRDMSYWVGLSMSSIYKILAKLEKEKLIKSVSKTVKGKIQKVYSLTPEGEKVFKLKVIHLLSVPEHTMWKVDAAIAFAEVLGKNELKACIKQYIEGLEERLKGYVALEEFLVQNKAAKSNLGLASRPQALYRAEIKWAKEYVKGI
jgi:DNA-binding PadR family transcriptional regulator